MLDKDVLDYPQVNDKIICLKNYQDRGLMNGTIWWVHDSRLNSDHTISMTVKNVFDDDEFIPIKVESTLQMFQFKDKDTLEGIKFGRIGRGFDQFDFGYAITVHKAQGSQWDDVVVYDDSWPDRKDPDFRYRWLYTAITRAAKTVKIIGKR
jgi:exodeoxyribonuclease-5